MVGVRRAPSSRGSHASRVAQVFHIRLILFLVAALYGVTVLVSFGLDPAPHRNDANSVRLEELLESPHVVIPPEKPNKPKGTTHTSGKDLADLAAAEKVLPDQQKRDPPIKKEAFHLEEPDIHMQHPDALNKEESKEVESPKGESKNEDSTRGLVVTHDIIVEKTGTGPTSVAYVLDLDAERANPNFRHAALRINDSSSIVAAQIHEAKVTSCMTLTKQEVGPRHWTKQETCLAQETRQIVYNAASFPRMWCGQEIAPSSVVVMKEHCSDDVVYLFGNTTPPVSGQGMAPMTLLAHHDKVRVQTQSVDCDIPCVQETGISVTEAHDQRYFEGEPWVITQTIADSMLNPYARIERIDYRRDMYYSTQSFKSSVPLSFYNSETFNLRNRPAVSYESTNPKAVYMANTECVAPHSKRQKYFAAIIKIFPIDSMGDCHHNTQVPDGMTISTMEGRIAIMKQYRFVLAFDRTKEKDQISPAIWEAMISGSIPIIVSAENIRLHLPARSFIDSNAYSDWDELAVAIQRINGDQKEWESYHTWRTDEQELSKFEAMYEFTATNPFCRLCRWGYAKKYGLGWDHVKQQVRETHVPRNLCTSSDQQLASRPFQEEWISLNDKDQVAVAVDKGADSDTATCKATVESVIDIGSAFKIHRKILEHDGLIDILITEIERASMDNQLVLRLHIPGVRNSEGSHFADTHTAVHGLTHGPMVSSASIQDDYSKVTLVADWVTKIWSPDEGVLAIVVVERNENDKQPKSPLLPNIPKRMRIIIEDMNSIHDKMTEYFPSSFASKVIKDFVDPLEIYY